MKSDYQLLIIYKIKLLREQHNISQNKMANYLGIGNGQMGNIEGPKMSTKYTLSQIYSLCKSGKMKCDALIKRNVFFSSKTKCNKIKTHTAQKRST